jgi:membrane associated rhomboid family serine protease
MRDERGFNLSAVWFIIGVNIILFVFTIPYSELKDQFGLQASAFTGEPWTIVTYMFIHADFFHIFGNMVSLYFLGTYLSVVAGERNFLIIYFLGGLLAGAFSLLWALYSPWAGPFERYDNLIGASGAVFAAGGALAVLRPRARVALFFIIPMPLWVGIAVIFVFLTFLSLAFPISWQAHLGGLLLGLAAGFILRRNQRYRSLR